MAVSTVDHLTVASYALGVLDPTDAALAESHLATCDRCARDYVEFSVVTELLSQARMRLGGAEELFDTLRPSLGTRLTDQSGPGQ